MKIVLASGSPRRFELLNMMGFSDLRTIVSSVEEAIDKSLLPEDVVCSIALKKAKRVSQFCEEDDIIVAADTLVYLDGMPMEKPIDEKDAAEMLMSLSGRQHTVFTGVVVLKGETVKTAAEKTDVFFREISEQEISAYIKTGEPMDKAGAYGAQGRGAVFIKRIEGDFFNVMGLPICRLTLMLKEFGVNTL